MKSIAQAVPGQKLTQFGHLESAFSQIRPIHIVMKG